MKLNWEGKLDRRKGAKPMKAVELWYMSNEVFVGVGWSGEGFTHPKADESLFPLSLWVRNDLRISHFSPLFKKKAASLFSLRLKTIEAFFSLR